MVSKKILVADEDAMIRELFEYFLGKAGYSVYTAASSEETLEILSQESIPVIFIGLGLVFGELNGFELCEKIRRQDPNAIIYALTGYANLFHPQELRKAGFANWFEKPSNIIYICQVLSDTFAKMNRHNVIERILIIDDDDQFREMLREMLEYEGYTVLEARDGEEGMRRQTEQPADLILIDVIMPGKDGVDTLLEIKEEFPESKFIVTTGKLGWGPDTGLDIAQIFGARILRKPFQRKEILEVIQQLQNEI